MKGKNMDSELSRRLLKYESAASQITLLPHSPNPTSNTSPSPSLTQAEAMRRNSCERIVRRRGQCTRSTPEVKRVINQAQSAKE